MLYKSIFIFIFILKQILYASGQSGGDNTGSAGEDARGGTGAGEGTFCFFQTELCFCRSLIRALAISFAPQNIHYHFVL
jgi:hypothetical protein